MGKAFERVALVDNTVHIGAVVQKVCFEPYGWELGAGNRTFIRCPQDRACEEDGNVGAAGMGHQGQCGKAGRDGTGTNGSLGAIAKSKHKGWPDRIGEK